MQTALVHSSIFVVSLIDKVENQVPEPYDWLAPRINDIFRHKETKCNMHPMKSLRHKSNIYLD